MPIYNLKEYSDNFLWYQEVWNYYRDEVNDDENKNNDAGNHRINDSNRAKSKYEFKIKIIGSTPDNNSRLDTEVAVWVKYLSNFWRSLDLPLINSETYKFLIRNIKNSGSGWRWSNKSNINN